MTARMYSGWAAIRAGLTKNSAALHRRPLRHLAWLLLPVASRRPWAAVVVSAGGRLVAGQNPLYGLLCPLARVVLAGLAVESWYRARTGRHRAVEGPSGAGQPAARRCRSSSAPRDIRRRELDVTDGDIAAARADRLE